MFDDQYVQCPYYVFLFKFTIWTNSLYAGTYLYESIDFIKWMRRIRHLIIYRFIQLLSVGTQKPKHYDCSP